MHPHTPLSTDGSLSTFICEDQEGVTVAEVACEAVREHQAAVMRDQLRILAGRNGGRLAIGLDRVTTISASFLCDLLWIRERCERLGGRLVLFGATGPVLARLESLRLCAPGGPSRGPCLILAAARHEAIAACRGADGDGEPAAPVSTHRVLAWLRGQRAA